jgi:hypothetical protein
MCDLLAREMQAVEPLLSNDQAAARADAIVQKALQKLVRTFIAPALRSMSIGGGSPKKVPHGKRLLHCTPLPAAGPTISRIVKDVIMHEMDSRLQRVVPCRQRGGKR